MKHQITINFWLVMLTLLSINIIGLLIINNNNKNHLIEITALSDSLTISHNLELVKYKRDIKLLQFEKYSIKFGKDKWDIISNGDVEVGFTEEMVILSWGLPTEIKENPNSSQFTYDSGKFLYIENDTVTVVGAP